MIEYKDSSHKELGLAFAKKDLDVTGLSIIDSKRQGNVEFGILGASHYVKFYKGDKVMMTEVFSCAEFDTSDVSVIQVKDVNSFDLTKRFDEFKYEFESSVLEYDAEGEGCMAELLRICVERPEECLIHEFPYEGEPKFSPITAVVFQEFNGEYIIGTVHAYPNENKIVITQTRFKNEED